MYKDLDKRRTTTRARVRRYRQRQAQGQKALQVCTQSVTKGVTLPDFDADGNEIPEY